MKKAAAMLLIIACLFGLMSISAFAANEVAGVYGVTGKNGYELTPLDANSNALTEKSATVDGKDVTDFYEGAERFTLTGTGTDDYYLVLMLSGTSQTPTESNIYYIDQDSPDSTKTVTFGIYPKAMQKGEYHVYISSSSSSLTEVASFSYYQPYKLGDVNDDGKINSSDALMALQSAVKKIELTDTQFLAADVNKDNKVNSSDALKMLQYAVKKINSFD